jgi:hypothetical protein
MRGLIFGTTYADTPEKQEMVRMWTDVNNRLNPGCEYMLVDSASPLPVHQPGRNIVMNLGNNIGHLARGGRDGWGRAFCLGLRWAIDAEYDFVAHVEGDSLFRLPVMPIFEEMQSRNLRVASVPVRGTRSMERRWVETGLMLFDVQWLRASRLIEKYDWENGTSKMYPHTPEWHLFDMISSNLYMMPWSAERGDSKQITTESVGNYDWITHAPIEVMRAFAHSVMEPVVA